MKLCIKCTKRKPLDEFALNQAARNGRMSWCKVCKRQYNKDRRKVANDKKVAMGIPITRDISGERTIETISMRFEGRIIPACANG